MSAPKLVFDNKDHFADITTEEYSFRYDEVILNGHHFKHIAYGIYAADPVFVMEHSEAEQILIAYRNVEFIVIDLGDDEDTCSHRVYFAHETLDHHAYGRLLRELNWGHLKSDERFALDISETDKLRTIERGFYHIDESLRDNPPEPRSCFLPKYERVVMKDGSRPWIRINNHIGIMVEDGIYFFPRSGQAIGENLYNVPIIDLNSRFDVPAAGICYSTDFHPSFDTAVEYLAIGAERFSRLQEICRLLSPSKHCYYHEFGIVKEEDTESDESKDVKALSMDDIMYAINSASETEESKDLEPETGAIEILERRGFYDLEISYSRPFFEDEGFKKYDMAYRLGDVLVLVKKENGKVTKERHKLQFLSGLYVRTEESLKCGMDYPVIHPIIDCKEERLREILTPEAYELYVYERDIKP